MGVLGGAVDENRGPHLTSARLIPPSERLRCTDSDLGRSLGPPSHLAPSAASSPSALACWARFEKFPRTHRTSALHSPPQSGQPTAYGEGPRQQSDVLHPAPSGNS